MNEDTQATGAEAPVETTATDTAAAQPSEANVQAETNTTPEANQEVKEPDVKAEDTVQEEKLYAGKYKSVEEMEKAYQELNSKFTNTSQEKAELARILNEAFIAPEQQAPAQTSDTDNDDFIEESNSVNPVVDELQKKNAVTMFILSHQDANPKAMEEVLASDPYVAQIGSYEAKLEYAFLKSQNMTTKKAIAEAEKKSAEQTQKKIVEKQAAQVESAKSAEPANEDAELLSQAKGGSPKEREAARMALIRKHLVNL